MSWVGAGARAASASVSWQQKILQFFNLISFMFMTVMSFKSEENGMDRQV